MELSNVSIKREINAGASFGWPHCALQCVKLNTVMLMVTRLRFHAPEAGRGRAHIKGDSILRSRPDRKTTGGATDWQMMCPPFGLRFALCPRPLGLSHGLSPTDPTSAEAGVSDAME